jgi:hypothetical protein
MHTISMRQAEKDTGIKAAAGEHGGLREWKQFYGGAMMEVKPMSGEEAKTWLEKHYGSHGEWRKTNEQRVQETRA